MANLPFDADTAKRLRERNLIDDATFKRFGLDLPPEGPEPADQSGKGGYQSPVNYADLIAGNSSDQQGGDAGLYALAGNIPKPAPEAFIAPENSAMRAQPGELDALAERLKAEQAQPAPSGNQALASDQANQAPLASDAPTIAAAQQMAAEAPYQALGQREMAGYDLMDQGIIQEAAAGKAQAAKEAAYINEAAKQDMLRQQQIDKMQADQQDALNDAQAKYQDAVNSFANMKVDKNRLWGNMSSNDKVLAGIGMFLGAFGSGDTNQAVKVINDAIDRDIQEQEATIKLKGADVANRRGILGDMMSRFQDERQAKYAAKAAYLDNAKFEIQKYASQYTGTTVAAKAAEAIGKIEVERSKAMGELMKSAVDRERQRQLGGAGGQYAQLYVPGYGYALTPADATAAKNMIPTAKNLMQNLDDMISLRKDKGPEIYDRSAVARGISISTDTLLQVKNLAQLGVLSKEDKELIDKLIPEDPLDFSPTTAAKLDQAKTLMQRRLDIWMTAHGLSKQGQLKTIGAPQ